MRQAWRILLCRNCPRSSLKFSNHFQVLQQHSPPLLRSLSSSFHTLSLQNSHLSQTPQEPNIYNKTPLVVRDFSSEASLVDPTKDPDQIEEEAYQAFRRSIRELMAKGDSVEKIGLRVSRIIRDKVWGEDVEGEIKDLSAEFSSDLVKIVLDNLAGQPMKALIFFRWVEESGLFKHDERSYNAAARVLGRKYCIDKFWKVIDEMRSNGFEMEMRTFDTVSTWFLSKKMIEEAIDLYEFAMNGANKPSAKYCTDLLSKMTDGKQLDMGLFLRVVKVFSGNENVFTHSMPNAFCKANEIVDHMEPSGNDLNYKAWTSLIKGLCVSGDLEKASDCLKKLVEEKGGSGAGYVLELLVKAYCRKNRAIDACNLLRDYVCQNQLYPWQTTYKVLISKLLVQGGSKDALNLLGLMQSHGIPPYIAPFYEFISKSGTGDDAIAFMNAITTKKFPSISVALRLFEAFFKADRHGEAQDFLSKCPIYIRNDADVLNLFRSMRSSEDTTTATVSV